MRYSAKREKDLENIRIYIKCQVVGKFANIEKGKADREGKFLGNAKVGDPIDSDHTRLWLLELKKPPVDLGKDTGLQC